MKNKVIVIGSSNTDMVIKSQNLPEKGETVMGGVFEIFAGGKGANQAVAIARSGADVTFVSVVGDDDFGKVTIRNLKAENIDTKFVKTVSGTASGVALIMVDEDGENIISVAPGANYKLSIDDINEIDFSDYCSAVFQLEIPMRTVEQGIRSAGMAGCKVILNPAPAAELENDVFEYVDYLIPNRNELALLAGNDNADFEGSARSLIELGVKNVIVTLGSEGALYINADETINVSAFKVEPVDTVGAGDCFVGNFTAALAEGQVELEAIKYASAAAALSVQKHGAQTSMPTKEMIMAFQESAK
jgi:ribokinase